MKARVKETGKIVDETAMVSTLGDDFYLRELEPISDDTEFIDYWTRLEHQYAGMAMQSYVSNNVYLREIREMCKEPQEMRGLIADLSILLATALVQKLKEKEE